MIGIITFSVLRSRYLSNFSPSFIFTLWFAGTTNPRRYFKKKTKTKIWSSGLDGPFVSQSIHFIFEDRFLFLYITFVRIVKFHFLVAHFTRPDAPILLFFLRQFAAFIYSVIDYHYSLRVFHISEC